MTKSPDRGDSILRRKILRKLSSAGRASALQAEGHRFEPYSFHHRLCASHGGRFGPVVQLVRTLACHARGREFEPHPGRQFASVAQLVEQGTENPRVIGSIPIGGTKVLVHSFLKNVHYAAIAHLVERHLAKVEVASSSLVGRSSKQWKPAPKAGFSLIMVTWPSGKARVCKTLIHQFKSGRHLQVWWSFWITATFLSLYRKKLAFFPFKNLLLVK